MLDSHPACRGFLLVLQISDSFFQTQPPTYVVPINVVGTKAPSQGNEITICQSTTYSYNANFRFSKTECGEQRSSPGGGCSCGHWRKTPGQPGAPPTLLPRRRDHLGGGGREAGRADLMKYISIRPQAPGCPTTPPS